MLWLMAIAMVGWGMRVYMPYVEGYFFPVVEPAKLLGNTPAPPPTYRNKWAAEAEKLRSCVYASDTEKDGLQWFLGQGNDLEVTALFLDRPQERTIGLLEWSELIIALDPIEVQTNSHAYVWHQCPGWWRFWKTRSLYYQSPEAPEERKEIVKEIVK